MSRTMEGKKNILIVTEYFYPEEFKITDVAIEWKKKGYNVEVLTTFPTYPLGKVYNGYKNKLYKKDLFNGIIIHRLKAVTGYKNSLFKKLLKYFSFMFLGSFFSIIKGNKYDYILGFSMAALTGMAPATIINKLYKKNVTLWVQDVWPDSVYAYGFKETKFLKFFLNKYVKYTYEYTSNFGVSSLGFMDRITPFCNSNKDMVFIPNWADDLKKDSEKFTFSNDAKLHFTFAGNIGKVQNLDNIIKAFGQLPEEYVEKAQLNLIGDGSYKNYLEELVEIEKFDNIVFWGKKDRSDIGKYLRGSDFLIVSLMDKPIFSITIPAKFQTYLAARKPIFAVFNGDVASLVKEHNLGVCSKPSEIENIIEGFKKLIELNELEKTSLIEKCDFLSNTMFNKEIIINSLESLLLKE